MKPHPSQDTPATPRVGPSWLTEAQRLQLHRVRAALDRCADGLDRTDLVEAARQLRADIDAFFNPKLLPESTRERYAAIRHRLDELLDKLSRCGVGVGNGR